MVCLLPVKETCGKAATAASFSGPELQSREPGRWQEHPSGGGNRIIGVVKNPP